MRRTWLGTALLCAVFVLPLSAIAEGEAEEEKKEVWTGSVNLGVAITEAETSSQTGNFGLGAERKWGSNEVRFGADGIYAKADGDVNANNQNGNAEYRRYFTDRFYGFHKSGVSRDTIQLIKFRYAGAVGPGYRVWQKDGPGDPPKDLHFDVEMGVGYLHQQYLRCCVDFDRDDDVENGVDTDPPTREDSRDDPTLNWNFEHVNMIGESLEITHTGSLLLPVTSTDEFQARTELIASVPLVLGWAFRNGLIVVYQNEPAEDADKTSLTYTAGLEYKF